MFFSDLQTAILVFFSFVTHQDIIVATHPLVVTVWWICIFFWILFLFWVLYDANRKKTSLWITLLSLWLIVLTTPLIWWPFYLLLRPKKQTEHKKMKIKNTTSMKKKWIKEISNKKNTDPLRECSSCWRINKSQGIYCMYCGSAKD